MLSLTRIQNVLAKPSHEATSNLTFHQDTVMERRNFLSVFGRHLIAMNMHPLGKRRNITATQ